MKRSIVVGSIGMTLCWGTSQATTYTYNETMCAFGTSSTWEVGDGHTVDFAAGANRTESTYVPVSFYLSPTPTLTGASIHLKTNYECYIQQPGPYCSSVEHDTLYLPSATHGSCFMLGTWYIVAQAGADGTTMSSSVSVTLSDMPSIDGFSPSTAPVGGLVTITGSNFDDMTYVEFGSVPAARAIVDSTTLMAQVPEGATSGTIRVGQADWPVNPCNLPGSPEAFVVDPVCLSTADYAAYGAIDYVATTEFVNNTLGSLDCPAYTSFVGNSSLTMTASPGQVGKTIDIAFGSCGAANYEKLLKMYIDWNGDDDFVDPGEFMLDAPSVFSDVLYQITMNIPSNVQLGPKRVRFISAVYDGSSVSTPFDVGACGVYNFGETEDYILDIVAEEAQALVGDGMAVSSKEYPVVELIAKPIMDELGGEAGAAGQGAGRTCERGLELELVEPAR